MRKLLLIVCLLATPCVLRAQKNESSWENLNALRSGEKIEVVEARLKNHKGAFVAYSAESITFHEGAANQSIKKENVMRVTRLEKTHRLRNALIVGAVGAGAGAAAGAGVAKCHPNDIVCARGAAIGGGAVGGLLVGAAIGAAIKSPDTIYRATAR